ncbi:MAG: hypothetical protein HY332_07940 [Chloroflexi bacterium]|nr:hypothetical protein [Chloroflexota bacterium]
MGDNAVWHDLAGGDLGIACLERFDALRRSAAPSPLRARLRAAGRL